MPKVKVKAVVSFEEMRKALLVGLTASANGQMAKKVIRFQNDDVPRFLSRLDAFETRSRQTCLMVK